MSTSPVRERLEEKLAQRPSREEVQRAHSPKHARPVDPAISAAANVLESKFAQRPSREEFKDKHLVPEKFVGEVSPGLYRPGMDLEKHLLQRPRDPRELERLGIVAEGEFEADPSTVEEQKRIKKQELMLTLEQHLVERPSKSEQAKQLSPRFNSDLDNSLRPAAFDLESKLQMRVDPEYLERHHVSHFSRDMDPSLQPTAFDLEQKLARRPMDPAELERRRIAMEGELTGDAEEAVRRASDKQHELKDTLESRLAHRPSPEEFKRTRGTSFSRDVDPSLQPLAANMEKWLKQRPLPEEVEKSDLMHHFAASVDQSLQPAAVDLEKRLAARPKSPKELEKRGIAREGEFEVDPGLVESRERLKKEQLKLTLDKHLAEKPSHRSQVEQLSPRFATDVDTSIRGVAFDLENRLKVRPSKEELSTHHVTPTFAHSLDPTLQSNAVDLEKLLAKRTANPHELEQRGIIHEGELEEEDPSTVQEKEREAWEARKRELEVLVVGRPSPQQFKQQMSPRFASDLDPSLQGTAVDLETVLSKRPGPEVLHARGLVPEFAAPLDGSLQGAALQLEKKLGQRASPRELEHRRIVSEGEFEKDQETLSAEAEERRQQQARDLESKLLNRVDREELQRRGIAKAEDFTMDRSLAQAAENLARQQQRDQFNHKYKESVEAHSLGSVALDPSSTSSPPEKESE